MGKVRGGGEFFFLQAGGGGTDTTLCMFPFLFNRSQSKAGVVNQLNQTATGKKKNYVPWVIYNKY